MRFLALVTGEGHGLLFVQARLGKCLAEGSAPAVEVHGEGVGVTVQEGPLASGGLASWLPADPGVGRAVRAHDPHPLGDLEPERPAQVPAERLGMGDPDALLASPVSAPCREQEPRLGLAPPGPPVCQDGAEHFGHVQAPGLARLLASDSRLGELGELEVLPACGMKVARSLAAEHPSDAGHDLPFEGSHAVLPVRMLPR
ncbi:MAG: hypothetical protein JW940_29870 [Polyangiaceae bacterium]|nr:hypothetical protein [Polyangiaceae bacterium]